MHINDLFPNAEYFVSQTTNKESPCVPAQFMVDHLKPSWCDTDKWDVIVNGMDKLHPDNELTDQEITQSVYYHLVWLEDMIAIYEDRRSSIAESHIAIIWNETSNIKWKYLMGTAIKTETYCIQGYVRPSLCLITMEWFNLNKIPSNIADKCHSITFREVSMPPLKFNEKHNNWNVIYKD